MNKKYIFIGVGILAFAGIGFMIWKSKKDETKTNSEKNSDQKTIGIGKETVEPTSDKRAMLKRVIGKKIGEKNIIATKTSSAEGVEEVVEVNPVQMIPDRSWLERSWADVV